MRRDYLFIFYVVLLALVGRLIFSYAVPALVTPEFHFLASENPYFFEPDSFYYYVSLSEKFSYFGAVSSLFLVFALSIVFVYLSIKELCNSSTMAFYGALLYSFLPSVYNQTFLGYLDTNSFILLFFSIAVYGIAKRQILLSVLSLAFLSLFWNGVIAMFTPSSISRVFELKSLGVAEYSYLTDATMLLFYVVAIISLYIYYGDVKQFGTLFRTNEKFYLYALGLSLAVASLFVSRLAAIASVFLVVAVFSSSTSYSIIFEISPIRNKILESSIGPLLSALLIIAPLSCLMLYGFMEPTITRSGEILLREIPQSESVVAYWDRGHVVQYFCPSCDVPFKAEPSRENLELMDAILCGSELQALDALEMQGLENASIFLGDNDLKKISCDWDLDVYSLSWKVWNGLQTSLFSVEESRGDYEGFYLLRRR